MIRKIATLVLVTMFFAVSAEARLISTDFVMEAYGLTSHKETVRQFLERSDVAKQLESLGVTPEAAKLQVALLTDDQIAELAQKIDSMPAGGDILGVALFVFLVLLATDIFGLTKVFPFTKPIR